MIETVAAFLALFSAGIFAAHAVDAYTQVAEADETMSNRDERQRSQNSSYVTSTALIFGADYDRPRPAEPNQAVDLMDDFQVHYLPLTPGFFSILVFLALALVILIQLRILRFALYAARGRSRGRAPSPDLAH